MVDRPEGPAVLDFTRTHRLLAGVNWSGARAAGYDVEPAAVLERVEEAIARREANRQAASAGDATTALVAERPIHRIDMHRVPIAVLLLLLGGGCASSPPDEGLAEHLAALREGSRSLPLARDARGTVVLCMGTRVAVRMDPADAPPEWPWTMAIYDDHVYKAEFEPVERVGDNLLGFLVTQRPGQVVKVGDHAWCKTL